jgi:ATP-binding cassette, subfamily C, bacterial CydD
VEKAWDQLNQATMVVLRRAFVVSGVLDAVITCAIAGFRDVRRAADVVDYLQSGWLPSLGFTGGLLVLMLCPVYFAPLRDYAASYHKRDEALDAAQILHGLTSHDEEPAETEPRILKAPQEIRLTAVTVDPGPAGRDPE